MRQDMRCFTGAKGGQCFGGNYLLECALFTCMVLRLFVLWRLRVLAGPASRKERVEMKATIIFLGFAQYIPYFISMFRGRPRPSVSGWLCFALSLFVTLVASLFMGSISILVSCGMGLLCQIFIIVAEVRQGRSCPPVWRSSSCGW